MDWPAPKVLASGRLTNGVLTLCLAWVHCLWGVNLNNKQTQKERLGEESKEGPEGESRTGGKRRDVLKNHGLIAKCKNKHQKDLFTRIRMNSNHNLTGWVIEGSVTSAHTTPV